ncbi:MAG: lipoyl protein ligase domain-containing protein, partial [Vogesella sp.]|uniref:lipoyl protein ligase domain-containing protein n=1 Tax=Vogesella sp. TaxID=1904252 RepID=UPI003F3D2458
YVAGEKIASLGLRIKNGAVYHGLSLNVDMDLTPFSWINPCGYAGLKVTQLKDQGATLTVTETAERLLPHLERNLTVMKETA